MRRCADKAGRVYKQKKVAVQVESGSLRLSADPRGQQDYFAISRLQKVVNIVTLAIDVVKHRY